MLLRVIFEVVVPIFVIICVGSLVDRIFRLDLPTLNKLNFYVFVPALVFIKLLDADLPSGLLLKVGAFTLVHAGVLYAISLALFSGKRMQMRRTVLCLGTIFFNAGNYGIPLTILAFGDALVGVTAIIVTVSNFLTFTFGIWLLERRARKPGKLIVRLLQVPTLYAIVAALALRAFDVELSVALREPLSQLANGLIPIALLTLGVQLSRRRVSRDMVPLSLLTLMRLIVSPLVAFGLVRVMGFAADVSALLIVAAGLPVAVNVYILSAQYQQDEEIASQAVFWTTLLSAVTVTILLLLVR